MTTRVWNRNPNSDANPNRNPNSDANPNRNPNRNPNSDANPNRVVYKKPIVPGFLLPAPRRGGNRCEWYFENNIGEGASITPRPLLCKNLCVK